MAMNTSIEKSAENLTGKAINRLVDEVLPALQEQLFAISRKPAEQRSCDESTRHLVVEALDLFATLRVWLGGDFPFPADGAAGSGGVSGAHGNHENLGDLGGVTVAALARLTFNGVQKSAPMQHQPAHCPGPGKGLLRVETSLVDALVERVDLLDSDQLRLQSVVKLIAQNQSDSDLLQDLLGLASRFAEDLAGVRGVVDILKQSPSTELVNRLAESVSENAVQAGLRYEVKSDFSDFDMDHGQLDGLVDALAATAQLLAVSAITSGDPLPIILIEGRKASGLVRVALRTETPLSTQGLNLDALTQQFVQLKGQIFEGTGNPPSLVCEVPSSLRSMKGIVVKAGGENYALPVHGIVETMRLDPARVQVIGGQEFLNFRSSSLPLVRLTNIFGKPSPAATPRYALIVSSLDRRFGLVVDELIEHRDLALRTIGGSLTTRPEVVGGAVDSDGRVIMVIDARKFRPEYHKPAA